MNCAKFLWDCPVDDGGTLTDGLTILESLGEVACELRIHQLHGVQIDLLKLAKPFSTDQIILISDLTQTSAVLTRWPENSFLQDVEDRLRPIEVVDLQVSIVGRDVLEKGTHVLLNLHHPRLLHSQRLIRVDVLDEGVKRL
jgi:hypothetical protein